MNPDGEHGLAIATPFLALDPGRLDENLVAMAAACREAGVALRPHAKGHKSGWIARRQLQHGAVGSAVATLAEAAAMVGAGVQDVLLTSVLSPRALQAAATLAHRADGFALVVHAPEFVRALDEVLAGPLDVLIDLDVGQRRGGAPTVEAALAVAAAVGEGRHVRLAGVQGYEGHLQAIVDPEERGAASDRAMARLAQLVGALRAAGHPVPWVTTAGTGTASLAASHPVVSEVQPGSYALMDATYARVGGVHFAQAVHVVAGVTAVLSAEEVIVDAGWKALSVDAGPAQVAGLPGARYEPAGDEHGRVLGPVSHLRSGDEVWLVPSHTDTTTVLHEAFVLPGGEQIAIDAR